MGNGCLNNKSDRDIGKDHVKTHTMIDVMLPQAKEHQQLEKTRKNLFFFSRAFRGSITLLSLWFWTSNLQNWERRNFYCFKPLSLWYFVTASLGHSYSHSTLTIFLRGEYAEWCHSAWRRGSGRACPFRGDFSGSYLKLIPTLSTLWLSQVIDYEQDMSCSCAQLPLRTHHHRSWWRDRD